MRSRCGDRRVDRTMRSGHGFQRQAFDNHGRSGPISMELPPYLPTGSFGAVPFSGVLASGEPAGHGPGTGSPGDVAAEGKRRAAPNPPPAERSLPHRRCRKRRPSSPSLLFRRVLVPEATDWIGLAAIAYLPIDAAEFSDCWTHARRAGEHICRRPTPHIIHATYSAELATTNWRGARPACQQPRNVAIPYAARPCRLAWTPP